MKTKSLPVVLASIAFILTGYYPISVTRMKWRIKWDKEMKEGKEVYLAESNEPARKDSPNIVLLWRMILANMNCPTWYEASARL
jgi:hypothetical protein